MRRIFTYSIALACLLAAGQQGFSQATLVALTNTECNSASSILSSPTTEGQNFNNSLGLASFFGAGWEKTVQGSNQYLSIPTALSSQSYTLTTPTYGAFSNIFYLKFAIGGSSKVASYTVSVQTNGSQPAIQVGQAITNGPSGVTGDQCLKIENLSINSNFRFVITFTIASGQSGSGTLTFDNFFITHTTGQAPTPLPVHFSGFNAKTVGASVALAWSVEAEQDVKSYEVERSNDGRSFTTIGSVAAASQKAYSYTDNRPLVSAFYRIKSVDIDGKFLYSSVISLRGGASVVLLRAFMSNQNTLTIQHDAAQSGSRISVSSADGRLIKSLAPSAGSQQTVVDISSAKAGLYLVRFDNGNGEAETLKVVKQQ